MTAPWLQNMRGRTWFRAVALAVLLSLAPASLIPAAGARTVGRAAGMHHSGPAPAERRAGLAPALAAVEMLPDDSAATVAGARLRRLERALQRVKRRTLSRFMADRAGLPQRLFTAIMQQRWRAALVQYRSRTAGILRRLRALGHEPPGPARVRALKAQAARIRRLFLPAHRAAPRRGSAAPVSTVMVPPPDHRPRTTARAFRRAGLYDDPPVRLAALGAFTFDRLPGADDPAYLAATPEAPLSGAVAAKAAELGHDAVRIYAWVHDNIDWVPTWGATQDADLTLDLRRGNDMDIASLTIALLRASGIPARYVHGTIDVAAARFRNWSGGFGDTAAAADLAASGGIPVTDLVSGGAVAAVRLEHVWVEAAIDYAPSRGAVNRDADSWVQLDPSFKQYDARPGPDLLQVTGLDAQQLARDYLAGSDVGGAGETAAGLDTAAVADAWTGAIAALDDWLAANAPSPDAAAVLGGRRIAARPAAGLPDALPYHVVVVGARYARLPSRLEHRLDLSFGTPWAGTLQAPVSYPWAAVNNHDLTLSFRPATDADARALAALLPDGPLQDISQLPTEVPSYLIRVVPELRVDGALAAAGAPVMLGDDVAFSYRVTMRGRGADVYVKHVTAGSYLDLAVVGGGVGPSHMEAVKSEAAATAATLAAGGPGVTIGRDAVLGTMFHAGALGYFAQYDLLSGLLAGAQGARHMLGPSTGTFGYEPSVRYAAGIPLAIGAGGAVMDIDRVAHVIGTDPMDLPRRRLINMQCGAVSSALEHAVPQWLFGTPGEPVQAVSAVKALFMANARGQRLYHLTPSNRGALLPAIHQDIATLAEVASALDAGRDVITHDGPVSVPGWSGGGYIVMDPLTGDAAYKIGGGYRGGVVALDKLLSPVFTFWETWDVATAGNVASAFTKALNNVGSYLGIAAVGVEALENCGSYRQILVFLGVFSALATTMSKLVASLALSPLGGILTGLVIGQVVDEVVKGVKNIVCVHSS